MSVRGRTPRVGLVVDHPKRDLAGLVLVARALALRGVDAFLIPLYEQAVDVPLLGLDALVLNYARPVNFEITKDFARSGVAIYVLDTEGGVLADDGPNTPHKLAGYMAESGYAGLLAGYFFWGPVLRDAFAAGGVLPDERLHLTGCPRFDYAAPAMRALIPSRRTGHILVNTNFPIINSRFTSGGEDRQALLAVGIGADTVERLIGETRKVMTGMIETVRRLSAEFPDQRFVLRPHPFERDALYREAFADQANVVVDGAGSVFEALNGARALLHVNCGTAIDAIMLGVPPFALEFLNSDYLRNHASLPSRASLPVNAYAELAAIAGGALPAFDAAAQHAAFAEPWFHLNDAGAAGRVADALISDLARRTGKGGQVSIRRSLSASRPRPSLGQRAQSVLANLAGSLASSRLRMLRQRSRREKSFRREDIDRLLAPLAAGGETPLHAARARHPLTKAPLASLVIRARGALTDRTMGNNPA